MKTCLRADIELQALKDEVVPIMTIGRGTEEGPLQSTCCWLRNQGLRRTGEDSEGGVRGTEREALEPQSG